MLKTPPSQCQLSQSENKQPHQVQTSEPNSLSQSAPDNLLTFVTATLAPLLMSWTTLSAWPLCEATRRRSESARTVAASCWLMKQGGREGGRLQTQGDPGTSTSWPAQGDETGTRGGNEEWTLTVWRSQSPTLMPSSEPAGEQEAHVLIKEQRSVSNYRQMSSSDFRLRFFKIKVPY